MEAESFTRNVLLRSLEPAVLTEFEPRMRGIELRRGEVLYSIGAPIERVCFPTNGLVGVRAETSDGDFVESAIVGAEGAIGAFEACGSRHYLAEAAVLVPGEAVQMSAAAYRDLFEASPALRTAVHRYVEQLMSETRQFVVCNSLHPVGARLARLLLEALDKSGSSGDSLPLTQDMLARMLGAQRTTVAQIVSRLQKDGTLGGRRGIIEVADRVALEQFACSCREALRITRGVIHATDEPACEAAAAA